jgi:hypothetical protein
MLLFQIPMGMQKNFFEMYSLFGHAPSKIFASPGQNFSRTRKRERHVSTILLKYVIRELQKVACKTNEQPDQVSYGEAAYRAIPGDVKFGWNACCSGAGD